MSGTVFGSNGALDAVRQCQSNKFVAIALTFRYLWLSPKIAWPRQSSNCVRLCARLSLSLAVAEDGLASAKLELRSALRSAFAIFDGCRRLASPRLLRLKRPRTSLRRYPAKLGFGGRPAFGSVGGAVCIAFRHEGKGRNLFWSCASFAGFRKGREWLLEGAFTAGFMNPRRKVPWNLLYDLKGGVFNG